MNHILGIIALVLVTSGIYGQSTENPFDLKYREARPRPSGEVKPSVISQDSIKANIALDKQIATPPVQKEVIQDDVEKVETDSGTPSSSGIQNPFETSIIADTTGKETTAKEELAVDGKQDAGVVATKKQYASRGFQIFFLLFSILFLIFIVNVERSFIRDLWRVISNENYSSLHHRNQRNTMRQILLLMGYLIFIFQAGLFINQSLHIYQYTETVLASIWVSIAVVLGVYLVRHTVIRYLQWLFNNEKELSLFAFDISIFNTMIGLILLPINILLIFGPEPMYKTLIVIGLSAFVVAYLLRQLRWMVASRRFIVNSLFLFFIYLCAVEILPLWTISKIFW